MKTKKLMTKKNKKGGVGYILLICAAITGACTVAATMLKKKREKINKEKLIKINSFPMHPKESTVAAGCQKAGQNEVIPGKTSLDAVSSEWERGVS